MRRSTGSAMGREDRASVRQVLPNGRADPPEAPRMSETRTRQLVTVATFVITLAINGAANALPINGQTTGEISDRFRVFVIPAGYVFGIWGVIYVALAAFTIYQALRGADPVVRRV